MNTARLHIRSSADAAAGYFSEWLGGRTPKADVEEHPNGWTTFELSGFSLDGVGEAEWLRLGARADILFETFSTSLLSGELVLIMSGKVQRHLLIDSDNPEMEKNAGRLRYEEQNPLTEWTDIWTFVEDWYWEAEVDA